MSETGRVAIIGAGPAGLMAAEHASQAGMGVDIYDAMPSFGRKFLMAGKSGLNITHTEGLEAFLQRYDADRRLVSMVRSFSAKDVTSWMNDLGIEEHIGPTGRVFPSMMKASPLLRAWLNRLTQQGCAFFHRHHWTGWDADGALMFETPDGAKAVRPAAVILALGGASWQRLGSTGAWAEILAAQNVPLATFQPSNCGLRVAWSDKMKAEFAGHPVKAARLSASTGKGEVRSRGEFVVTERGIESGAVYELSLAVRKALATQENVTLTLDLLPDVSAARLRERLAQVPEKQSLSNRLRKGARLSGVKLALVYECTQKGSLVAWDDMVRAIKALPISVTGMMPMDEAISTAGGVRWRGLDERLMLKEKPGVFCAGEMLDWDAPTGGYLITACLATGKVAGEGAVQFVANA